MIGIDKELIAAVVVIFIMTGVYFEYSKPTNFEECVLHHMKGQKSNLLPIAGKLCKREFPKWEVN